MHRPPDDVSMFENILTVIGLGEDGFTTTISSVELGDIPNFVKAALSDFPNRTKLLVVNQTMSYNMNLSAPDAVSTLYAKINDTKVPQHQIPWATHHLPSGLPLYVEKTMPVFWLSTNMLVQVSSMCMYLSYCILHDSCSSSSPCDSLSALSFVLGHLQNKCGHRQTCLTLT